MTAGHCTSYCKQIEIPECTVRYSKITAGHCTSYCKQIEIPECTVRFNEKFFFKEDYMNIVQSEIKRNKSRYLTI